MNIININCPICGHNKNKSFKSKLKKVYQCTNSHCNHIFTILNNEFSGVHDHDFSNVDLYKKRNKRLIRYLIKFCNIKPNDHILDIGSGLGHIVSELKRQEPLVNITCVEKANDSISILLKSGFNVVDDIKLLTKSVNCQFKAIFLIEVIEHLVDPLSILKKCRELLVPGGIIFITTPCGELRNGSHEVAAYGALEHIQFFTKKSLTHAFQKTGFSCIKFFELREFHVGPDNILLKWLKDYLRILRNKLQGEHHLIVFISN